MRKTFTNNLPKRGKLINFKDSIGYMIHFIYDNIEGDLRIIKYIPKGQILTIEYNGKEFDIRTGNLAKAKITHILNIRTSEFKIEIGTRYKDTKRDIIIIDREYRKRNTKYGNEKWYKYHCNRCGWDEGWTSENSIEKGIGCSCCDGKSPVLGINTIWDTDRWMYDLGVSKEDAKTHTHGSGDCCYPTCPDCGKKRDKEIAISTIYRTHSIACTCGDGVKYPNKFMRELLTQLDIIFEMEYNPEWIKPRRYDFYIPSLNIIIEMDGGLGHGNSDNKMSGQTSNESQSIDDFKDKQAILYGIEKPIRIDCDYNHEDRFGYIKNSVLTNNKLNTILDLNKIDFDKCNEFALSNLVKIACELKRNNPNMTCNDIAKVMGYCSVTIGKWLKEGNGMWCNYDSKEELEKSHKLNRIRVRNSLSKQVEIFKDGFSLGIFESGSELERCSEELFNVRLTSGGISSVCLGKTKQHKGYTFRYI